MTLNKKTIEQMAEECPCKERWCFLKEFLLHTGMSDRTIAQARLMLDFRYLVGIWNSTEPTDEEAFQIYKERGYAEKFAKIYDSNPNITHQELFYKMFIEQQNA